MAKDPIPTSAVSSDVWQKHLQRCTITMREAEEANGRHRAALKVADQEGIPTKALLGAIRARRKDESVVLHEVKSYIRALHEARIGISPEAIYGDWKPEAPAGEDVFGAGEQGYRAGKLGQDYAANPFPAGSESHQAWAKSWKAGQAALAAELPTGQRSADAARKRPARTAETAATEASSQVRRTAGRKAGRKAAAGAADPEAAGPVH